MWILVMVFSTIIYLKVYISIGDMWALAFGLFSLTWLFALIDMKAYLSHWALVLDQLPFFPPNGCFNE
jgi:hypothetical protein